MRRSLLVLALMSTTCLTPVQAKAEPVSLFLSGFIGGAFGTAPLVGTSFLAGSGAFAAGAFASQSLFALAGGTLLNLGLSIGLSAIARKLAPKPPAPTPIERIVNFAQPLTAMEWVFGQVRKGGPYAVTSFQTDRRHYGVILASHEITAIDQWYIDNQSVEVVGDVVTTAPFTDWIGLRPYLGSSGQTADATLVNEIPEWTVSHNMAGLAYVAAFARRVPDTQFSEVYGNSSQTGPVITPVIRGVKVYDPRTETTDYSNNAALVWAWATENRLGEGKVDWEKVAIEADASDVLVTNRSGGTQHKWTLNGVFSDDTDYETILQQIILSCDGYSYEKPDGTIGFYVGRYITPTITLTDDDFYSAQLAENEFGQDPATEFIAQYVEPVHDWIEAASSTFIVDADARINRQTIQILYVNSHNQAMRCLKRIAKSNRAEYTVTGTIGLIALDLLEHRFVNVSLLGKEFIAEIGRITPSDDDTVFTIELNSVQPEDFDFVAALEEPAPPPRDQVTSDNVVPEPTGLSGSAIEGSGIEWTWTEQPIELNQQFRFRAVGASDWQPSIEITDDGTDLITSGLIDGQTYEAELRNITPARRSSGWISSGSVTALANANPPDPILNFTATPDIDDVILEWDTPNDPLHNSTRIYRSVGVGSTFSESVLIFTIFGSSNISQTVNNTSLTPETYVYWATSVNASGVQSILTDPVSVVVA